MQFQYNADFPKDDDFPGGTTGTSGTGNNNNCKIARDPWTFPAAHPVPCTRITTRVYHPLRQTVTTVQNVLVRSHTTNTNSNNTNGNGNSTNNSNIRKSRQSCRPKTTTLTGEEEEVPVNLDTDVTMKDDTDDNSSNSSSSNSDFSSSDEDAAHPPHSSNNNNEDDDNECAYWIQRTVREAIYGRVLFAIVLKKRRVPLSFLQQQQQNSATVPSSTDTPSATAPFSSSSPPTLSLPSLYLDNAPAATIPNAAQVETMSSNSTAATAAMIAIWEVTPFHCAVKEMSWQHIRKERHRLAENPIQEISAMQYLQSYYYSRSQQPDTTTTNNDNSTNNNGNTTQNLSTNPSLLITTTATTSATKNETVDDSTFRNNETKNNNSSSSFVQTAFSTMTATNLMMPLDILSDDGHLYSVMPYCNGGELFEWLDQHEKFPEAQARYWMHQILNGLESLQHAGICHRDLSLENLLVHESGALIIDLGMCLRVPVEGADGEQQQQLPVQSDQNWSSNFSNINIVQGSGNRGEAIEKDESLNRTGLSILSNGTKTATTAIGGLSMSVSPFFSARNRRRYLLTPQGTCGKWIYMSPEIYKNSAPFDGFAVDMWAAGVILFLMLTGFPPWDRACSTDERFRYMSGGYLVQMLTEWELGLSPDAMDLLQRMLFVDPKDRLSLDQVRAHPWMVNGPCQPPPPQPSSM